MSDTRRQEIMEGILEENNIQEATNNGCWYLDVINILLISRDVDIANNVYLNILFRSRLFILTKSFAEFTRLTLLIWIFVETFYRNLHL